MSYFRRYDDDPYGSQWWEPPPGSSTEYLLEEAIKLNYWYCEKQAEELLRRVAYRVTLKHEIARTKEGEQLEQQDTPCTTTEGYDASLPRALD